MKCGHHGFILNIDNLVAAPDVGTRSRASKRQGNVQRQENAEGGGPVSLSLNRIEGTCP